MDCRLFERQLQLDIDGLLSAKEREAMLRHAQICPSCATLMRDITEVDALLAARLSAVEPPAGFVQAVMAALPPSALKQAASTKFRRSLWRRWGTVAAAAALLVVGGLYSLWPAEDVDAPLVPAPGASVVATNNPDADPGLAQPLTPQPNTPGGKSPAIQDDDPKDPPVDDQPQTVGDPEEDPVAVSVKPPVIAVVDPDDDIEPYVESLDLPHPAVESPPPSGMFALTVLAAYEDCDAILPSLNEEGRVEFYTKYKNKTQLWTQSLSAEEKPQYQDKVNDLPALTEITGSLDESVPSLSKVSAVSPDGRFIAVNRNGEQPGVWLYANSAPAETTGQKQPEPLAEISAVGGGKVLCWSADSNKLLYTDSSGKLYVYYNFLKKIDVLYNGMVSCASWAEDNKTVVFSGKAEKATYSVVYSIIVP
jgi:hypothetical protein